jgi:NADPH-dependent 2,4-dienoyl-CoA reductase/sulfur reductase-like enzyme
VAEQVAVVGSGQAGLVASAKLARAAVQVILVERLPEPGGQEPEVPVVADLAAQARDAGVGMALGTMAVRWDGTAVYTLGVDGARRLPCAALVVATGTRPASRAELGIAGDRPAGIVPGSAALHLTECGVLFGRRPVVLGAGSLAASCVAALRDAGAEHITVVAPDGILAPAVHLADDIFERWAVTEALGHPRVTRIVITRQGASDYLAADALILAHKRAPMRNIEGAIEPAPRVVFCHSHADPKSLGDAEATADAATAEALALCQVSRAGQGGG